MENAKLMAMNTRYRVIWIFFICIINLTAYAGIIYVDIDATGSNNGSSWTNAFTDLNAAIGAVGSGDTIVVAKGIYHPHVSSRAISFDLKDGIGIFGGFAGNEITLDSVTFADRDFIANESILSGDINNDDAGLSNKEDNSYHVVRASCTSGSMNSSTVLDGFTIENAYASQYTTGNYDNIHGGGIYLFADAPYYCNPLFRNLLVKNNIAQFGGGIAIISLNNGAVSNPKFYNCIVENNICKEFDATQVLNGAGILVTTIDGIASPEFYAIEINHNSVPGGGTAGGVSNSALAFSSSATCSPLFHKALFCGNLANGGGTAIHNQAEGTDCTVNPRFINVTVAGGADNFPVINVANSTGSTCNPEFINCILFSTQYTQLFNNINSGTCNPTFAYCNIKNAFSSGSWNTGLGTNLGSNIDYNPEFIDTSLCDVRLYSTSPSVGTGNLSYGANMGYYQDEGLIRLFISDIATLYECNGDTLYSIPIFIEDEPDNDLTFLYFISNPGFGQVDINDSSVKLSVKKEQTGSVNLKVYVSNKEGELDSTNLFTFSLAQKPHLDTFNYGYFTVEDTSFLISVPEDTAIDNEKFFFDGIESVHNYVLGMKPGDHYIFINKDGCNSDTIFYTIEPYINNKKLVLQRLSDDSVFYTCTNDTSIDLTFKIIDDNYGHMNNFFFPYYMPVIPDDNIVFEDINDSVKVFHVQVPGDSSGYHEISYHAENIYGEMANIHFQFYIGTHPVIDTISTEMAALGKYCAYFDVSEVTDYNYLNVIVGEEKHSFYEGPVCQLDTGKYVAYIEEHGCFSDPFSFSVIDTTRNGEDGLINIDYAGCFVYPNPVYNLVTIKNSSYKVQGIEIIDLAGKVILSFDYRENTDDLIILSLEQLAPGNYLMKIKTKGNANLINKIIKN